MSLQKGPDDRRYVEVEVEVPGTPEEVWRAIATGEGISSWFMPTKVDGRVGGLATTDFGPGMEDQSTITSWDPPHRYGADSFPWGPEKPPVATEWIVEAKDGGTCIVRVVHSLFSSDDDWDDQLEGFESGWPWFFRILRLYLERFAGQPSGLARVSAFSDRSAAEAWDEFTDALALKPEAGRAWKSPDGSIELALERVEATRSNGLLAETKAPAPGIASAFTHDLGDRRVLSVSLFLYGEEGVRVAPEVEARLQEWLSDRFRFTP